MQEHTASPPTATPPRRSLTIKTGIKAGLTITQSTTTSSAITQTGQGSQSERIVISASNTYP